jgi:hypothetical protein
MEQTIELPYGGQKVTFTVEELISHFRIENLKYIIIGARQVTLGKHPKPKSFDVWLRNLESVSPSYINTCQAVGSVITKLISLNQFSKGIRKCPTSNRMCKALIFSEIKQE